ncbi:transcriptional regulator [Methyloceanibacter sp. wino2]|uniref:HVO_A0114 family putative DNA-binding protein n=1 Tax=Methyloceanibacter sp. wino2 TaxID=2170729 RepID=UPI001ABA7BC1|nr:transcriptional regulator [Methyloceanibacter sp. wino2]
MSKRAKILRIGIASREQMKARTIAIARGEHKPGPNEPKVWFTSMESLAQVLSSKNTLLLELIRRASPASIRELAQLSGRKESNLSRTLKTMQRYKLVQLETLARAVVPKVPYDRLVLEQELGASNSAIPISFQAAQNARRRQEKLTENPAF